MADQALQGGGVVEKKVMSPAEAAEKREVFLMHLNDLVSAGYAMNHDWIELEGSGYPDYLPSFDEFLNDLMAWRDAFKAESKAIEVAS